VKKASDAMAKADTVVFNGGGLIGVEMAGDCRVAHPTGKRIVLLTRDGKVLSKSHPPEMQAKVHDVLTRVLNVEIITGSAPRDWLQPRFEKGSIPISGNDSIASVDFDFYMPCFAQGPRNEMLSKTDALDASGRLEVNECLQSTKYPSIFGVNTTTHQLVGHPIGMRVGAAAVTCAKNAVRHLREQPPLPHVDKEMPGPLPYPMNIKIGHGKGGYMIWDLDQMPLYLRCMMGAPCGLGYPCFPCVCCECCCPISGMLGNCCGPPEGEGPAKAMECMLGMMGAFQGINGLGKLPPEVATMTRP